jgi:hypothetical protein
MFDLKPKRFSPLVTLALLLVGMATGLLWHSLLSSGQSTFAVAGEMPEPAAMAMLAFGGIVFLKKRRSTIKR